MAYIKNPLSGGGGGGGLDIVNGIIEQYKGSEDIDAQTFVEKVNASTPGVGQPVDITAGDRYDYGSGIAAVALDDTKVLVVCAGNASSKYLYGRVCTVSGGVISAGTATVLLPTQSTGNYIAVEKLSNSSVIIAHSGTTQNRLSGVICNISGDTITVGTDVSYNNSNSRTDFYLSIATLGTGKVFVAHTYSSSNYYIYGIVWTISGNTISMGTDTAVATSYQPALSTLSGGCCAVDTSSVFVCYAYSTSSHTSRFYQYGVICTVSGSTISVGDPVNIYKNGGYSNTPGLSKPVLLGSNKIVCALIMNSDLVFQIVEINGTAVSAGAYLSPTGETGYSLSNSLIGINSNGAIYLIASVMTDIYGFKFNFNGESITLETKKLLLSGGGNVTGGSIAGQLAIVKNNFMLVTQAVSNQIYAVSTDLSDDIWIKKATDPSSLFGLTYQSVTQEFAGNVWVLNTSESE